MRILTELGILSLFFLAGLTAAGQDRKAKKPFVQTKDYRDQKVEGWTVKVNKSLLADRKELGAKALRVLQAELYEISRLVPEPMLGELRKVPIWLGVDDGSAPCAEYHPDQGWLKANGYNPDKAKAVEIGNAGRFVSWIYQQPMMVLHELAHAYHNRVLGFDHKKIKAAYEAAKKSGTYDEVLRYKGTTERAYALTDPMEYFAEGTEAFFGENDYFPFVRVELRNHDPRLYRLLVEIWGGEGKRKAPKK